MCLAIVPPFSKPYSFNSTISFKNKIIECFIRKHSKSIIFSTYLKIGSMINKSWLSSDFHFHLLFACMLLSLCECNKINFRRVQTCLNTSSTNSCKVWNTTIELSYDKNWFYFMCFPEITQVQTETGPRNIRELEVGDRILGYDFEQDRNVYSKIEAWLHRDTDSSVEFTVIRTENGSYKASNGHNIGFIDNGNLRFKYADELKTGDELISLDSSNSIKVLESDQTEFAKGLYSPITSITNFYIFPQESTEERSLILLHCLAQIPNPEVNEHWIHKMLSITNFFGINHHTNEEHEVYLHPIVHFLRIVGSEHRNSKIILAQGDDRHLKFEGASKSKKRVSSSSWISGFFFEEDEDESEENEKEEEKKMVSLYAQFLQLHSLVTLI